MPSHGLMPIALRGCRIDRHRRVSHHPCTRQWSVPGGEKFPLTQSYQLRLQQLASAFVPCQVFLMLPYALSILALILMSRRAAYPRALMIPYRKGER
jgi:ABC-type uncharacterized transport system permease subunit